MCMYELITLKRPFSDMEAGHGGCRYVMKLLLGARPQIPDTMPDECQKMMGLCWHVNPSMRPTFQSLIEHVTANLAKFEEKAREELSSSDDHQAANECCKDNV